MQVQRYKLPNTWRVKSALVVQTDGRDIFIQYVLLIFAVKNEK